MSRTSPIDLTGSSDVCLNLDAQLEAEGHCPSGCVCSLCIPDPPASPLARMNAVDLRLMPHSASREGMYDI